MNSKKFGDLRCGNKSAVKKVKGFTLLELIIVVAIIAILAGISSVLITGYIRDANCESVNNRAQQVYASVQNMLVECEIDNDTSFIDPKYVSMGGDSSAPYVYLTLVMNNGELDKSNTIISNLAMSTNYAGAAAYATKSYDLLKRYLQETLAADFTGGAMVCIDIESFAVDSVVYAEDPAKLNNAISGGSGQAAFVDEYQKNGAFTAGVKNRIYGCKDIYHQKDQYDETGYYIGYYPYMSNVASEFTLKVDKFPHI